MKNFIFFIVTIFYSILSFAQNKTESEKVLTSNGIKFTVVDTAGTPIAGAKVSIYDSKTNWRIDSARIANPIYTDGNGQVEINSLLPIKYWFNIEKDYKTNRFTVIRTDTILDASSITNITVPIRDLSQNELYLCGLCNNKTWITDSLILLGSSQLYDADSKLLSDGTWYDSNGNHGYWFFNSDESILTYDYDSSSANGGGSTVAASSIVLSDTGFVGNMTMFGLPVTYYMSAIYDTINLSLSVKDTSFYLDGNSVANITPDDLIMNHSFCFPCSTTLSKSSFGINNIGDNIIYVTLEDRCGNQTTDTVTIKIKQYATGINEIRKSNITIFPNPSNDFVVVESKNDRILNMAISDIHGRILEKFVPNKENSEINVSGLKQGIYYITLTTENGVVTKKLIVE